MCEPGKLKLHVFQKGWCCFELTDSIFSWKACGSKTAKKIIKGFWRSKVGVGGQREGSNIPLTLTIMKMGAWNRPSASAKIDENSVQSFGNKWFNKLS